MSEDYVEDYQREKRRIAPFQQHPDWQEWLRGMQTGLQEFFGLVPDMPEDPWTEQGARHAEHAALNLFGDLRSASLDHSPDNRRLIDPFRRYLGEIMVRRFDGTWLNIDLGDDGELEPAVRIPYSELYFDVSATLTMAMNRRTGDEWALIVRQAAEHQRWVGAGRPEPPVWQQMLDDAATT